MLRLFSYYNYVIRWSNSLKRLIPFIFLFLTSQSIQGQDVVIKQFGPDDGLASSETYHILQDSDGYFWICTDRGIVKYDGYDFISFDNSTPGIDDHTFFKGYEFDDEIWFTAYNQTITIYNKISKTFKTLKDHLPLVKERGVIFDVAKVDTIFWIYFRLGNKALTINTSSSSSQLVSLNKKELILDTVYLDLSDRVYLTLNVPNNNVLGTVKAYFDNKYPPNGQDIYYRVYESYRINPIYWRIKADLRKKFNDPEYEARLIGHSKDVSYLAHSEYLDKIQGESKSPVLKGFKASRFMEDRDKSYWLTTLNKGLILTKDLSENRTIVNFDTAAVITSINLFKNNLVLGSENGDVNYLNIEGKNDYLGDVQFLASTNRYIYQFYVLNNDLCANNRFQIMHKGKKLLISESSLIDDVKGRWHSFEGNTFLLASKSIQTRGGYTIKYFDGRIEESENFNENIQSISSFNDSMAYLGTLNGLYQVGNSDLLNPRLLSIFQDSTVRINKLKSGSDFLAIASSGSGFAIYRNDQPFVYNGPISSPLVNSMTLIGDSLVFLGTNKGIDKIRMNHSADSTCFDYICTYSIQDLLLSNYIHDLCFADNKIFYSCDEGLAWFHLNDTIPKIPAPKIHIDYLSLGDSIINDDTFVFKNDQNDIAIHFTGISTKKPKNNFYKYFLTKDEKQGKIFLSDSREVRFNDLDYGQYTFNVAAQNYQETWSPYKTIDFIIKPHLFQTIWFQVLVSALFLTAVYLTYLNRLRTIKRKEAEKNKILQLEKDFNDAVLSSIQSQINPHFVFNALQSIQGYILKNDTKTASEYLSKFSTIMRAGLEFSSLEFISMEDEVHFLKNYLSIEKLRFPQRFNFEILFNNNLIHEGIKIPPLVLQPILENAVKHAFLENHPKNLISVKFQFLEHQNCLSCSIKDNGVGFYNSNKLNFKQGQHISKGISLVKRRVDLLKQKYGHGSFILLSQPNKRETKIIIELPII